MSFSSEVKQELTRHIGRGRHCQIAELAALVVFGGGAIHADTQEQLSVKKYHMLTRELFDLKENDFPEEKRVCETLRMWNEQEQRCQIPEKVNAILLQQNCCRRAFLRGAFLMSGSMSDPNKSYHFEIVCRGERLAEQTKEVINGFGMDAKIVARKKHWVVYLKEGAQIVDILNIMEAHVALMNLENVRIFKEMRNSVNRKVNCETANISKTVNAAVSQLRDIEYIRDNAGLSSLPDNLKEIALLRLEYPDAPLKELGTYLESPVGKSGVNHRLRRISEIAQHLREQKDSLKGEE